MGGMDGAMKEWMVQRRETCGCSASSIWHYSQDAGVICSNLGDANCDFHGGRQPEGMLWGRAVSEAGSPVNKSKKRCGSLYKPSRMLDLAVADGITRGWWNCKGGGADLQRIDTCVLGGQPIRKGLPCLSRFHHLGMGQQGAHSRSVKIHSKGFQLAPRRCVEPTSWKRRRGFSGLDCLRMLRKQAERN
eukprot:525839-Pelagomonas_calceolata.AAC.2